MAEQEPFFDLEGYPATKRVMVTQEALAVDADDPAADAAEVALLRREGNRGLVMLPLVVKGETLGVVELIADEPITLDERRMDLAHTMANEAAINLGNAQLYVTARALADRDPLTGFYNHRYLHERLGEEILRAQRSAEPVALLMVDLDDFKLVNDTLGHLFGDEVLKWAAGQIRAVLRASDVPTRYGGDEFALILPATTADEARAVGDRIVHALAEHAYRASGHGPVPVTASIGAAAFPAQGRTPRELIAVADRALYRVKRRGGAAVDGTAARIPGDRRRRVAAPVIDEDAPLADAV
jgi:diguanylate cyclase (GGDEF)-like protein